MGRLGGEIEEHSPDFLLSTRDIDDDFTILIYGVVWGDFAGEIPWSVICQKLLGVVVVLDKGTQADPKELNKMLSLLEERFDMPMVIASRLAPGSNGRVPQKAYRGGLSISENARFTFYQPDNPGSVRHLIVDLINIKLESIPQE